MPVGQSRFDERIVAMLLRNFGVRNEACTPPLDKLKLDARYVALAAVNDALQLQARRLRVAARYENLAGLRNLLVVRVRVCVTLSWRMCGSFVTRCSNSIRLDNTNGWSSLAGI